MEIVVLGTAAGLIVAAACMAFYRKGVRDGMGVKKGESPARLIPGSPFGNARAEGDEGAAAMMKRYETILSYDPYNSPGASFKNANGERV